MRYAVLCVLLCSRCLRSRICVLQARSSRRSTTRGSAHAHDGDFAHWAQGGHSPPDDIASNYYPALGVYSSSSTAVLNEQMADVARAGIGELAVSWWGKGSAEDQRLPEVIAAARQRGIAVAVHLEPYRGRSVASTSPTSTYLQGARRSGRSTSTGRSTCPPPTGRPANDELHAQGVEVFAQTALVGAAAAGHFTGVYTYDTLVYGGGLFARLCRAGARARAALRAVGRARVRRAAGDGRPARQAAPQRRSRTTRCGARRSLPAPTAITITSLQRVAGGHADRARRPAGPPRRAPLRLLRRRLGAARA